MLFVSSASVLTLPVAETTNTEAFTLADDGWDYIFDCGPLPRGTHRFELKMVSTNFPYTERFASATFSF